MNTTTPWLLKAGSHDDDQLGRRLIAAGPIAAGRLVLEEVPYACVMLCNEVSRRCDCCFYLPAAGIELSRCSSCKAAFFLDRTHQKLAWKRGHRSECAVLAAAEGRGAELPSAVRLAIRAVISLTTASDSATGTPSEQHSILPEGFEGVLSLQSHWNLASDASKTEFAQLGAWAFSLLERGCPKAAAKITPRALAKLVARISCNSHTVCTDEQQPIGVGIFPLTAMANHACDPNCVQSFKRDGKVELRTVRKVEAGEELTISYCDGMAPRWERRAELLQSYHFDINAAQFESSSDSTPLPTITEEDVFTMTELRGPAGSTFTSVKLLHVHYCGRSVPPWPHDAHRDLEYCALRGAGAPAGAWGELRWLESFPSPTKSLELGGEKLMPTGTGDGEDESESTVSPVVEVHTWSIEGVWEASAQKREFLQAFAGGVCALNTAKASAAEPPVVAENLKSALSLLTPQQSGDGAVALGSRHLLRLRLLAARLKALLDGSQNWLEALNTARELLPLLEFAAEGHAAAALMPLALHLATLAKLEHLVGELTLATRYARKALPMLETALGPGGSTVREVARVAREAAMQLEAQQRQYQ